MKEVDQELNGYFHSYLRNSATILSDRGELRKIKRNPIDIANNVAKMVWLPMMGQPIQPNLKKGYHVETFSSLGKTDIENILESNNGGNQALLIEAWFDAMFNGDVNLQKITIEWRFNVIKRLITERVVDSYLELILEPYKDPKESTYSLNSQPPISFTKVSSKDTKYLRVLAGSLESIAQLAQLRSNARRQQHRSTLEEIKNRFFN